MKQIDNGSTFFLGSPPPLYKVTEGKITILNKEDFNIKHILECGQIFRYDKLANGDYIVLTSDKFATIKESPQTYEIFTNDTTFFIDFFDLKTNYAQIKERLSKCNNQFLNNAIDFGKGIRILKNSAFEMIISFIISANNNIPRIKKSIQKICETYGKKIYLNYYSFPTLTALEQADEEFFKSAGLGYRANYLVETIKALKFINIENLAQLNTPQLRAELMKLKGVGRKVADCIMLFGFNKMDVFPIDTWTNKVYVENFYTGEKTRTQIADYFTSFFGDLSGYAQQYFYYWKQQENK